jgi:hypothetical protein
MVELEAFGEPLQVGRFYAEETAKKMQALLPEPREW